MNSVAKEVHGGMIYASTAHSIWDNLKHGYDKIDETRIFQLHREICTIHQGTSSISEYFSRLKLLWAEAEALIIFGEISKGFIEHLDI